MDPQRSKIPAEAVDLYTQFIHGDVSRRDFLSGIKRFAIGGLTTAAIVEALMPNYALGQQVSREDERIRASSGGTGAAALHQRRCGGCRLELNPVDLSRIRSADEDEVVRCEECNRILVRTPESGL